MEQRDKPEESSVVTQTDVFLPKPPSPKYVPKKTGVDAFTQIELSDGLFDFDVEVEPILDVIVGKILEQSVVELEQEQELTLIQSRKVGLCGLACVGCVAVIDNGGVVCRKHWLLINKRNLR